MSVKGQRWRYPSKCNELQLRKEEENMHLTENRYRRGRTVTEEKALADFRDHLSRRISNAVEAIYEEVPKEAWPRIASRLEAAGLLPLVSDQRRNR